MLTSHNAQKSVSELIEFQAEFQVPNVFQRATILISQLKLFGVLSFNYGTLHKRSEHGPWHLVQLLVV